jgi:hypothetical protein
MASGQYSETFSLILDSDELVEIYYFEVGGPQTPPEEVQFQTWHNSFYLINALGDTLMAEGTNPFSNNGQGALQAFSSPFWTTYSATPYCGDYCEPFTYGCIDNLAVNYDPTKNTDDGSCYYNPGCTNSLYLEYDAAYDYDNGSCSTLIVYGCMDSAALNYEPLANVEIPNSCIAIVEGCMDNTMFNYNVNANVDNGSCEPFIYGCTDVTAFNYDSLANTDDEGCVPVVLGCTEAAAFNYNPNANTDDNSCIDVVFGCIDPTMWNYCDICNTDNGSCVEYIYGCTDSTMFNYDATANTDNGSCEEFVYGCIDNVALNFNPLANTLDNSCCYISGCTDSEALNYDEDACFDDNSCIEIIPGCTDPNAENYNIEANVPDSSCYYSAGCAIGDLYYLPNECFSWVIDVDNYCCDIEWDETCDYLYEYCLDGWTGPVGMDDIRESLLNTYPNPTDGDLYFTDFVDVKVYDMNGRLILEKKGVNLISLQVESGIYNLVITYKDININTKIFKND